MINFRRNFALLINTILNKRLEIRHQENSFRKLSQNPSLIDFTSNDYLGLAHSEELFKMIHAKVAELPHLNGATGSRLLSGNNSYTEEIESKLAAIFKADAALIFNSGYAANQSVLSAIPQREDTILYDELAHACIRDGARLSFATRLSFRHNNLNDLEEKIKKAKGHIYIAVESIYSMDGDHCPLAELITLAEKYTATIILDEAHSTGVLGNNGAGLAVSLGLEKKIPIRIYTFGKAMGVHGACVTGSRVLIDYLINFARPFIFSTAMPLHSIASIDCAFTYLAHHVTLQQELNQRISAFLSVADTMEIKKIPSHTQIQGIVISGNQKAKNTSAQLSNLGFDIRAILSPTVAKGSERLRICLHTYNTNEQISNLVKTLSIIQPAS